MRVLLITVLASLVWLEYACQAHNFLISRNNTRNIVIIGNHLPNRTHADVLHVQTINQPLSFLVTEFFTTFPNMIDYTIVGGLHTIQEGAFREALNLESFGVMRSPLKTIPAYVMEGASKLTQFLISECNELEWIDQNAFVGLSHLVQISIGSSLRILPEKMFSTLNELRIVSISSRIDTVPGSLFDNNLKLEHIYFMFNGINSVDRRLVDNFVNMPNLIRFFFFGNNCGNYTSNNPINIDAIHSALEQCYRNVEQPRHLSFLLKGSLVIRDENGNLLLEVSN